MEKRYDHYIIGIVAVIAIIAVIAIWRPQFDTNIGGSATHPTYMPAEGGGDWRVDIEVDTRGQSSPGLDPTIAGMFGVQETPIFYQGEWRSSTDAYDQWLDLPHPPYAPSDWYTTFFYGTLEGAPDVFDKWATELKGPIGPERSKTWTMHFVSNVAPQNDIRLYWHGIPPGYIARMKLMPNGKEIDMRDNDDFPFSYTNAMQPAEFRITVERDANVLPGTRSTRP